MIHNQTWRRICTGETGERGGGQGTDNERGSEERRGGGIRESSEAQRWVRQRAERGPEGDKKTEQEQRNKKKRKDILLFLSVKSLIAFDESNWSFLKSNGIGVLRDGRGHITVIASLPICSAPKVRYLSLLSRTMAENPRIQRRLVVEYQ